MVTIFLWRVSPHDKPNSPKSTPNPTYTQSNKKPRQTATIATHSLGFLDSSMPTALHHLRLDAVASALLGSGARRVADLGCGDGELMLRLREHVEFVSIVGIDIDSRVLQTARQRLGLDLLSTDKRLQVRLGSFENADWAESAIDAAVLLETIEHIDPGRLSRVEQALFGQVRPRLVIVTTPNKEYNVLHGMAAGQRRHPGHRFEWTRAQFQTWASGVATRQCYSVAFSAIGPVDALYGSSTQMACFTRQP
jgi:small RNA 2'-O-methyltransferase